MHHSRLSLHSAAQFVEEPEARCLQAAHKGNGFTLSFYHPVLLA